MSKITRIEWIDSIPLHWDEKPLKSLLMESKEKNNPIVTENILSVTRDRGVIPYEEKGQIGNNKSDDIERYKLVKKNDLVVNKMNIVIGSLGISKYNGALSQVYLIYRPISNIDIRYYEYIFRNPQFYKYSRKYTTGIMELRESLNDIYFKNTYLPVPPKNEQRKIANFLDIKIAKITQESEKIKSSLGVVKDLRKKVIDDQFKNVENKIKLKYCFNLKGRIGWQGLNSSDYLTSGAHLITGVNFKEGLIDWDSCVRISNDNYMVAPEIHITEGDLLITKDGTIGKLAFALNCPEKVSLNSGVMLIRSKNNIIDKEFLYYVLQSSIFTKWYNETNKGQSTIKHLYQEQFYNFEIPLIDMKEQKKVCKELKKKISNFDTLMKIKNKQLKILEDYKNVLINDAVTGKIKIADEYADENWRDKS